MEQQYMTFNIGDGYYGINILGIREINYSKMFTAVPLSNRLIVGLLNLRGQIVTVLDTGIPLGYDKREVTEDSSLLIMKTNLELSHVARKHGIVTNDDLVGFLVDKIGDVISCEDGEMDPVPAHLDTSVAMYLDGVVKRDELLVGIINVPELLKFQ